MRILESAGQDRYLALLPSYVRGSSVVCIVVDLSNSECNFQKFWEKLVNVKKVFIVLVGMNVEFANEKTREKYTEMAKLYCLYYWETNSKADHVHELFQNIAIRVLIQHHQESVKNDRGLVQKCISFDSYSLEYVSNEFRDDEEIVMKAVTRDGPSLTFASERLRNDPFLIQLATGNMEKTRQVLLNNRDMSLRILRSDGLLLKHIEELNEDKELVLEAVKNNGDALQFADISLRNDLIFAQQALSFNVMAFNHISENLQNEAQIIELAISKGYPLERIKWSFQENNKELLLKVIQVDGRIFKYASVELQNDRDFVLAAVSRNGTSLEYASNEFRMDREIVKDAISSKSSAFEYVNAELQEDSEIILLALNNGLSISTEQSNNRKLVLESVKRNGNSLRKASKQLQSDREIVECAIESDPYSLEYASEELQIDPILISKVLERGFSLEKAASTLLIDNRNLVLECVRKDGESYKFASPKLQKDIEVVATAIKNGFNWNYQTSNGYLLIEAISNGMITTSDISISIRNSLDFILKLLNHLNEVHKSKSREEYLAQLSYFQNDYSSNKLINISMVNEVIIQSWNSSTIPCYELFSDYVSTTNTVLKLDDLREWGRRCKNTLKWARNVPDCLRYLSRTFIPNIDVELLIYFSNYRPKSGLTLLLTKAYSREFFIRVTLLKEISQHITKFNYLTIETFDYNKTYYLLLDYINENIIGQFFKNMPELINYQEINSFIYNISDIFPKQTMETFISTWISHDSFPKFQSLIEIINENKSIYQEERKFAQTIRNLYSQYIPISVLGMGAEGIVFECYNKLENRNDAFKLGLQLAKLQKDQQGMALLRQNIDGVIRCYDCDVILQDGMAIKYIIMEKGELIRTILDEIYQKNQSEVLNRASVLQLLKLFSQMLKSVNNIHNANFAHRDLKLANMVYVRDCVKIIDLDSSRVLMVNESCTLNIGTLRYLAPELYSKDNERILQNTEISKQCDMFSLGCILLEILTRSTLMLDSGYCDDSSEDSKQELFSAWGVYFHQAVSTQYLQHKLHHAIRLEIDKHIDSSMGINTILSRVIITMIQQNSNLRGNCGMFLQIFEELVNALQDDKMDRKVSLSDSLLNNLLDFNKNIVTILREEIVELKSENEQLRDALEKMKKEVERLQKHSE